MRFLRNLLARKNEPIWWMDERGQGVLNLQKALQAPNGQRLLAIDLPISDKQSRTAKTDSGRFASNTMHLCYDRQ